MMIVKWKFPTFTCNPPENAEACRWQGARGGD